MKAISAYMANRSTDGDGRRREYENRANERHPDQYDVRNAMGEYQPEGTEMRRRRDSRGRYMMDEDMPESRYRGRRMDDDDDEPETRSNVIEWPYGPHMPPESRMIGFGNRPREYEPRSHYDGGRAEAEVGGTMWMQPVEHSNGRMDKHTMEKWVNHMRDDKDEPIKPWSPEEIKPIASRFGYPTSGEKFEDFYVAIHMAKSDYCAVAEEFDVNTPAFYAALADAWLKDPDAALRGREKLETYYNCIVKGKK